MSLLDMLQSQLAGEPASQLGKQLGTDQTATQKAIGAALPALMAALAGNAARKEGASALANALEKDHDGGILDDLSGFLGKQDTRDGEGILKHALGDAGRLWKPKWRSRPDWTPRPSPASFPCWLPWSWGPWAGRSAEAVWMLVRLGQHADG